MKGNKELWKGNKGIWKGTKNYERETKKSKEIWKETKNYEREIKEYEREQRIMKGKQRNQRKYERETKYTMKMKEKQMVQRCQRQRAQLRRPQASGYELNIVQVWAKDASAFWSTLILKKDVKSIPCRILRSACGELDGEAARAAVQPYESDYELNIAQLRCTEVSEFWSGMPM
jgi:hypothetical protein